MESKKNILLGGDIPNWYASANCKTNANINTMFPDSYANNNYVSLAKEICRNCVVIEECKDYAITNEEIYGIWGGLTPGEREKLS